MVIHSYWLSGEKNISDLTASTKSNKCVITLNALQSTIWYYSFITKSLQPVTPWFITYCRASFSWDMEVPSSSNGDSSFVSSFVSDWRKETTVKKSPLLQLQKCFLRHVHTILIVLSALFRQNHQRPDFFGIFSFTQASSVAYKTQKVTMNKLLGRINKNQM